MAKKQKEITEKLYQVRCTECGEQIDNKFFPLDKLLECYYNGNKESSESLKNIIRVLRIGANYGQPVLPEVAPLMTREKVRSELMLEPQYEYTLSLPNPKELDALRCRLNSFTCENNAIPVDKLENVSLNISAIIAQFYLMTGFDTIYEMLKLKRNMQKAKNSGESEAELAERYNGYCDLMANLPGIRIEKAGQEAQRRSAINKVINIILRLAESEADQPKKRHFAVEDLKAGWRYKLVNGRQMPLELTVLGVGTGNAHHCMECCCDKCRNPIPYEFGAYRQKIIGLLGTQATGKTTYLTALTDAIDLGEVTTIQQSNGSQLSSNVRIEHSMGNDAQWMRINRSPEGTELGGFGIKAGSLWLYQHGFPPEKTDVRSQEAPALTFLVSRKEAQREPVMYTLADIPGEAFSNYAQKKLDPLFVQKQVKLLYSCDALIMVVSSRQMQRQSQPGESEEARKDELVRDPNQVLTCYKQYLPARPLPTAVVMTAADEINGGDLRGRLHLAYDVRSCAPLVYSNRMNTLVYNVEAMRSASKAVADYVNQNFGQFMEAVAGTLKERMDKQHNIMLAAFAVSSGTQCSVKSYLEADDSYRSRTQEEARCAQMRKERFGIAAPLLWLMACDGMLEIGRADHKFNDHAADIRKDIYRRLRDRLYY